MSITVPEKLRDRLQHAVHHREQLDAIAADMCELLAIELGSVAGQLMRSAAYGELSLNEALRQLVNLKLAELAVKQTEMSMQIEGCE